MDENSNISGDGDAPKSTVTNTASAIAVEDRNTNSSSEVTANSKGGDSGGASETGSEMVRTQSSSARTPFTNLSQEDADLALARTLQEQERAYMMLSRGSGIGDGRWDTGLYVHDDEGDGFDDSHDHEYDDVDDEDNENDEGEDEDGVEDSNDDEEGEDEDAFDVHAHGDSEDDGTDRVVLDPSAYPDDEAYARALQDAEEREMAARLLAMAGISEREVDVEDHESNSQDTWEDVDPDELSYEELIALGEVVGTESRGLSADVIATLPSSNYISKKSEEDGADSCVICRLDYEDDDAMTTLPCKHAYHSDCINNWLKINKACPVCSAEVSTSGNS